MCVTASCINNTDACWKSFFAIRHCRHVRGLSNGKDSFGGFSKGGDHVVKPSIVHSVWFIAVVVTIIRHPDGSWNEQKRLGFSFGRSGNDVALEPFLKDVQLLDSLFMHFSCHGWEPGHLELTFRIEVRCITESVDIIILKTFVRLKLSFRIGSRQCTVEVFGETLVSSDGIILFSIVIQVDRHTLRTCICLKPGDEIVEQGLLIILCNGPKVARVEYFSGLMGTDIGRMRIVKQSAYRL